MKVQLIYRLLMALLTVAMAEATVRQWLDKHLATCQPDERFGTFVWHTHRWWRRRWLASHSILDDGTEYRDLIPWADLRDTDIHVRVYQAGTVVGQTDD
jgi:hypothetical protein